MPSQTNLQSLVNIESLQKKCQSILFLILLNMCILQGYPNLCYEIVTNEHRPTMTERRQSHRCVQQIGLFKQLLISTYFQGLDKFGQ